MATYKLNCEVPWDKITEILGWHLQIQTNCYRHKRVMCRGGAIEKIAVDRALVDLCESYEAYAALRVFLGYRYHTKTQAAAAEELRFAEEQGAVAPQANPVHLDEK